MLFKGYIQTSEGNITHEWCHAKSAGQAAHIFESRIKKNKGAQLVCIE